MSNLGFLWRGLLLIQSSGPSELCHGESNVECLFPDAVAAALSLCWVSWVPLECSRSQNWVEFLNIGSPLLTTDSCDHPHGQWVSLDLESWDINDWWAVAISPGSASLDVRCCSPEACTSVSSHRFWSLLISLYICSEEIKALWEFIMAKIVNGTISANAYGPRVKTMIIKVWVLEQQHQHQLGACYAVSVPLQTCWISNSGREGPAICVLTTLKVIVMQTKVWESLEYIIQTTGNENVL